MKLRLSIICSLLIFTASHSMNAAALSPETVTKIDDLVGEEMREWGIGGVAIALVDDQQIVYAKGYGEAKRDSIFRVGSVSKLFNAIAAMQLVEAGKLDLDAPLPADLLPLNPYPDRPQVTLRQILCHRSGLPREPSVGGYFDPNEPGMAKTVASIRPAVLATRPGEKTRYSNFAPTIVGALVERASGMNFVEYQKARLLGPLGMKNSAWLLGEVPKSRLIPAHMRVADGLGGWMRKHAPVFDLGTVPAGNLFSTVDDLGRFASALCANGKELLKPETMAEMWRPQLTKDPAGFGLGFVVGKFEEQRMLSHNGAVYGFSTAFAVLPDAKIGVVVLANEDILKGRLERISNFALHAMLSAKLKELRNPPPESPTFNPPDQNALAGDYESESYWARLEVREGQLTGEMSGQPLKLTAIAPLTFQANSRLHDAVPLTFVKADDGKITGFTLGTQSFVRVPKDFPSLPKEWQSFTGSYGPDFIPLIISERHGHLYAMTENMVDYRLTPVNRNVCLFPPGMYVDEHLVFLTDAQGKAQVVNLAGMFLKRTK